MRTNRWFYAVGSGLVLVALLLSQGTTTSATSAYPSSIGHPQSFDAGSRIRRAAPVDVAYANNGGRRHPSLAAASFPFRDGFESGTLGDDWTVVTTNDGRVEVGSSYAYSGTHSLLLDDSQSDSNYSTAAAILTIDLSGQTDVILDFWWREFLDDNHGEDGVFISDDDGANWHQAFSFNNGPYFWRHQIIDLDEAAGTNGLTLNDHFQIKFQFYDDDEIPEDGYAIDEVQVRAPAVPIPASFPYYDGFESGELGAEWVTEFTYEGRVEVGSYDAYSGTYSLMLDDSRTDAVYSTAAAILAVDLSGRTEVVLDFWWREFLDDNHGEDGVFISDDDGANWHQVFSFNNGPYFWRHQIIDLDEAAGTNGLTLNDHFQIKFQFYDDDEIPEDGYAIDEVRVRAPAVPIPASFPYYDGFESGGLGDEWVTEFTYEGRVEVGSAYAYTGTYSLMLDDSRTDAVYSTAAAILTVDLSQQTEVVLDFWWREFLDDNHGEDGVFISDDDGANWHQAFSFNNGPYFWRHQIIDIAGAAVANGLTLNDHFRIKFQFYDDDEIPEDGYAIDEVRVRAPAVPIPASFPYYDGFESGELGDEWVTEFTYEGRVEVGSAYAYTGTCSLMLDDSRTDAVYSTAAAILAVDLSGQTDVILDFWWREFLDDNHGEDGVFISDDDGANWYKVFSFNDGPYFWRHQIIDLDEAAGTNGLTLNDHFQIKFQFYDDDEIPEDGYAIDEVRVRAPAVPIPASFPYYDGFESGGLGDEWVTEFTYEGRVEVGSAYAYTGICSLMLDDSRTDSIYSTAAAILTIDLSGQTDVMLDFWWREFYDENHTEDGVFISDDDGANWYKVFSFNDGPYTWERQVIDLAGAAAANGLTLNDHFRIKFQFYDDDEITEDGYAIDEVQVRLNAAPALSWPGDTNYEQDGLHPESGEVGDDYVYRIGYADVDGDPPGYVRVHIGRGGSAIVGAPFTMTCESGDYAAGVLCSYTKAGLEVGDDYVYYFAAQDDLGNPAAPTTVIDAPDVTITYRVFLPLMLKNAGPPAGSPILNPIDNPEGHYSYTVTWHAVERATRYVLEEDDDISFSSASTVYTGPATSTTVLVQDVGTYHYRVRAENTYGQSDWSNTESTVVTVPPPPCPQAGSWSGITDQGYAITFAVADTPDCEVTTLKITARLDCVFNPDDLVYTVEYLYAEEIVARRFEYSLVEPEHRERVSGDFTSQTAADGSWFFYVPDPSFPIAGRFCTGGGSWSVTYSP